MDGVVLAAGEGTRMRPLTADRPKGLVDVAGQPLVSYAFDALVSVGVDRLVVVVGYRGEDVVDHYGDSYRGTPIVYVRQDERLGTAHALQQALSVADPPLVVMNGDNVCRANLDAVVRRHRVTDAAATLLIESVSREQARQTGVVETGAEGRVTGLVEKPDDPPSTLVTRGFYAFDDAIGPAIDEVAPSARGEYELADAVDRLVRTGHRVETVELEGWCRNVNDPEDRAAVTERLP
ncbi:MULTISPECIES: nucleotidyltransferase family protein [Haloarcula]|uniref:UTP--glucose-1-phosphate uridylyltransferase n=1 Tax=Haloarcula pellucida TaxID=1427151 RepID=A0A830GNT8_9EURY|nr:MULTISPECIES: nucleotidyltransferase family protein [Halomicroarcula]MBX0348997.1 nucleotidyltransferase family protein [Halomicroarcula pellucida]MDS0279423.1 nucleotidyltransferase family protein [Halomicroarcula sp. S1AR25-4]GGN98540.1 UTP--glucose-1-phosphate uridylyltransferase [Halomicroarcula pellucida]